MAVAFQVSNAQDLVSVLAGHDEFLSRVGEQNGRGLMAPSDDYYTAPYCLFRTGPSSGYILFTGYTCRYPHDVAAEAMDRNKPLIFGCVMDAQVGLGVKNKDVFKFRDLPYADGRDISQELENNAVGVTCAVMGWKMLPGWRQLREDESSIRCVGPIYTLPKIHDENVNENMGIIGNKGDVVLIPQQVL